MDIAAFDSNLSAASLSALAISIDFSILILSVVILVLACLGLSSIYLRLVRPISSK